MAKSVLIIGKSGSGKSASMRNFDKQDVKVINVLDKELPFPKLLNEISTDDYRQIAQELKDAKEQVIVVDDAGYLITNMFMRGHGQKKGNAVFEFYSEIATNFWKLLNYIRNDLPKDKVVYVIMHEDTNDQGEVKPKTIGKMLDEKVNIQGMFTIVLRAMRHDNKYVFRTQTNGFDVCKSPIGMFDTEYIDNDLKMVTNKILNYRKGE